MSLAFWRKQLWLRTIPVIMLTGLSEKSKIQEALTSGTTYYIVKPFEFDDLLDKVRDALEERI